MSFIFRFKIVFIDSNTPSALYNLKLVGFFLVLTYTRSYQNFDFIDRWHAWKVISVMKNFFLVFRIPWSPNYTSDLMPWFDSVGHICDLRYLQLTNLAYVGSPRLSQSGQFGGILLLWQRSGFKGPLIQFIKVRIIFCTYLGSY